MFEVLNQSGCEYVVLRNFDNIISLGTGDDVDLLVRDRSAVVRLLNLTPNPMSLSSASFVHRDDLYGQILDLKEVGDNYLPAEWEARILANRVGLGYFFVPSQEDYTFSLWYHNLFHKKQISHKHWLALHERLSSDPNDPGKLIEFLEEQSLKVTEPSDFVVRRYRPRAWKKEWEKVWAPPESKILGLSARSFQRIGAQVHRINRALWRKIGLPWMIR